MANKCRYILRIYFFILLVANCLSACTVWKNSSEVDSIFESQRHQLLEKESDVSGLFFSTRTFHTELIQEVSQPEEMPYPLLDSLFKAMRSTADSVIYRRIEYDSAVKKIDHQLSSVKKIGLKSRLKIQCEEIENEGELLIAQADKFSSQFHSYYNLYQANTGIYRIKRLSTDDYAEMLGKKVVQWEDSLEESGRMLAAMKMDLKKRFPDQKHPDFWKNYQLISEFEHLMKVLDQEIIQLQNSESRFEEGNVEEFYYFGPYIRPRLETQANESILGELSIIMQDCRNKQKEYLNFSK
jgi:hypothetical protein